MAQSWPQEPYQDDNEFDRLFGANRDESWRGELHQDDDDSWRAEDTWDDSELEFEDEDPDAWQHEGETTEWPGPWGYRRRGDDEEAA